MVLYKAKKIAFLALLFLNLSNFINLSGASQTKNSDTVISLKSKDQLDNLFKQNQIIVIKFHAKWCPACKGFDPIYKEIAKKYSGKAIFADLDVDVDVKDFKSLAEKNNINYIPVTLILDNERNVLSRIDGADKSKFEKELDKLTTTQKKKQLTLPQKTHQKLKLLNLQKQKLNLEFKSLKQLE